MELYTYPDKNLPKIYPSDKISGMEAVINTDEGIGFILNNGIKICDADIRDCTVSFEGSPRYRLLSRGDSFDSRVRKALKLTEKYAKDELSLEVLDAAASVNDRRLLKTLHPFDVSSISKAVLYRGDPPYDHLRFALELEPEGYVTAFVDSGIRERLNFPSAVVKLPDGSRRMAAKVFVYLDVYSDDTAKISVKMNVPKIWLSQIDFDITKDTDEFMTGEIHLSGSSQEELIKRVKFVLGTNVEDYIAQKRLEFVMDESFFRRRMSEKTILSDTVVPIGIKALYRDDSSGVVKAQLEMVFKNHNQAMYRSGADKEDFVTNKDSFLRSETVAILTEDNVRLTLTGGILGKTYFVPATNDEKNEIRAAVEKELGMSVKEYLDKSPSVTAAEYDDTKIIGSILPGFISNFARVSDPVNGKCVDYMLTDLSLDSEGLREAYQMARMEKLTGISYEDLLFHNQTATNVSYVNMTVSVASFYNDSQARVFVSLEDKKNRLLTEKTVTAEAKYPSYVLKKLGSLVEKQLSIDVEDRIAQEISKQFFKAYPKSSYPNRSASAKPKDVLDVYKSDDGKTLTADLDLTKDNLRQAMFRANAFYALGVSNYTEYKAGHFRMEVKADITADGRIKASMFCPELKGPLPFPLTTQERETVKTMVENVLGVPVEEYLKKPSGGDGQDSDSMKSRRSTVKEKTD